MPRPFPPASRARSPLHRPPGRRADSRRADRRRRRRRVRRARSPRRLPAGWTAESDPVAIDCDPAGRIGFRLQRRRHVLEAVHPSGDRAVHPRPAGRHRVEVRVAEDRPGRPSSGSARASSPRWTSRTGHAGRAGRRRGSRRTTRAALVVAVECATRRRHLLLHVDGHRSRGRRTAPTSSWRSSTKASSSEPGPRPGAKLARPARTRAAEPTARPPRPPARSPRSVRAIGDPIPAAACRSGSGRRSIIRAGTRSRRAASPARTARSSARPASAPACRSLGPGRHGGDHRAPGTAASASASRGSPATRASGPRFSDRYRQWLTHKFSTWWDQFGSTGCVGCGRCIAWCPVGIDVREELLAIAPIVEHRQARSPGRCRRRQGRAPAPARDGRPAASRHPIRARVDRVTRETADTATLRLATSTIRSWRLDPASSSWPSCLASRSRRSRSPGSGPDGIELTIRSAARRPRR